MNSDPIIEAAARALYGNGVMSPNARKYHEDLAARLVPAITPLIRAAALEEAAKVAEEDEAHSWQWAEVAAAIRALKEQP